MGDGMFRAMKSRNYRLFFSGQILSLIGTWVESVAMSWLVYRLTGSELLLATVTLATQVPMFVMSPFAGVITDRLDRRQLLVFTQTSFALASLLLSALILTGHIQVWMIVATSVFVGVVSAFDTPGRQSFVVELVEDRADLSNAIALNSTTFNVARLIGPAIAGLIVRVTGEGICFLVNGISFLAVIVALLAMKRAPHVRTEASRAHPWAQMKEGAAYAWNFRPIRALLGLMATMSLVAGSYQVLLPVYAKVIFHGDSGTLGFLYSAVGVGALTSALLLARRSSVVGLTRWIMRANLLFAVAIALFAVMPSVYAGLLVLPFVGAGMMMMFGSTNTMIQTLVEDHMRGRVMSFLSMSAIGMMPLGSLIGGVISRHSSPQIALLVAGGFGLLTGINFIRGGAKFRAAIRPVYQEKGLLPQTV